MMNSSAGVPKVASGSASNAGGTWPCGETSCKSLTDAYSSRATVRRAGSAAKQRSGESVHGALGMRLFLLVAIMRRLRPLRPKLAQDVRRHLGLARAGE